MTAARHALVVAGSPDGVRQAAADFDAFAAASQLPGDTRWRLHLALDELLSNIARYGYGDRQPPGKIHLEFQLEGSVLELTIVDDGLPFDPLELPEPDTNLPAQERPVGGLGIFLVRKLMDQVQYERRDGRNRLVCRKRLATTA